MSPKTEITGLLNKYNISYIIVGSSEKGAYQTDGAFFRSHASVLIADDEYTVYDVRALH